jgi:trehalose 6-phosphate phosphatase
VPPEAQARTAALPHALEQRERLEAELGARPLAVFLDYDGTLCPIVSRPELAVLDAATRAAIVQLADRYPVAVVSGRQLADVRERVGLPQLYYSGNHGFEIDGPAATGVRWEVGSEYVDEVEALRQALRQTLPEVEGLLIEHKRYSLSIHYRLVADERVPEIEAALQTALREFPRLKLRHGKRVFEVRPDLDWHKGKAVRRLLEVICGPETLPIFIGDDVTDEDAFQELGDEGLGVLVNDVPRPTAARVWVRNVEEVCALLDYLARRERTS